jgi:hypothetical protein
VLRQALLRQAQQPCFDKLSNRASTSSATVLRQAQQPCFDRLSNRTKVKENLGHIRIEIAVGANIIHPHIRKVGVCSMIYRYKRITISNF